MFFITFYWEGTSLLLLELTVARARGSIAVREDYDSSKQRLDGLLPTVEDWHAKQCLLKVWLACTTISCGHIAMFCCRLYGSNFIIKHLVVRKQHYFNSGLYSTAQR